MNVMPRDTTRSRDPAPGPLRRALDAILAWFRVRGSRPPPDENVAFTSAFVALAAKLAKSDGVAVKVEQETFERFLEVDGSELANVRRVFNLAKEDTAASEIYAERVARQLDDCPECRRSVLECLIYVACSDGILHPGEDAFLAMVARKFGLSDDEWRRMRALFVHDPDSPYQVLDLLPGATRAEIRARYREFVAEIHPDRLIAAGAPAAVIKAANSKLAAINAAYEALERAAAAEAAQS